MPSIVVNELVTNVTLAMPAIPCTHLVHDQVRGSYYVVQAGSLAEAQRRIRNDQWTEAFDETAVTPIASLHGVEHTTITQPMPIPFRFPPDYGAFPTAFTGTKTLDGRVYRFRWLPNVRANGGVGAYYIDLYSVLAQPVVLGLKVTLTDDLWGSYRSTIENVPPGRVVVRRTDGLDSDPAIYDLTSPSDPVRLATLGSPNVVVEYVTLAEIAAASGTTLASAT